jgi:hypothetical protein
MSKGQSGFSVVELLLTLTVACVGVIMIGTLYSSAGRLADRSTDLLAANSIAYTKLQKYENYRFSNIPFSTDSSPIEDFGSSIPNSLPSPHEGKVFVSRISSSLKYIFVRVKYGQGANQHIVEYGDFVQSGGLGR